MPAILMLAQRAAARLVSAFVSAALLASSACSDSGRPLAADLAAVPAAAALTIPAPNSAPAATQAPPLNPLRLIAQQQLSARLMELSFATPALASDDSETSAVYGTGKVRVLLPAGYAGDSRRYPVLYLLHGAAGNFKDWTDQGNAEQLTAGLPLIVVMPDGGQVGEYSDHYNNGQYGTPAYETYHIGQLMPWIDGHLRTLATREGRAVAGLSMGGFGAMSYAARHPDQFISASSFSGAVDTNSEVQWPITPVVIFGSRQSEEVRWRGSNPVDLAINLRGMRLTLRTGNGMVGEGQSNPDPVEVGVHEESSNLHAQLTTLGLDHVWDDYGPGGHAWSFWQRDLEKTLPDILAAFATPPPQPATVAFTSISNHYQVFGWQVSLQRPVLEFSTLSAANIDGFTLEGTGLATVRTPAVYQPLALYRVAAVGPDGPTELILPADATGSLVVPVSMGFASVFQQFTAPALAAGRFPSRVVVTIRPA